MRYLKTKEETAMKQFPLLFRIGNELFLNHFCRYPLTVYKIDIHHVQAGLQYRNSDSGDAAGYTFQELTGGANQFDGFHAFRVVDFKHLINDV